MACHAANCALDSSRGSSTPLSRRASRAETRPGSAASTAAWSRPWWLIGISPASSRRVISNPGRVEPSQRRARVLRSGEIAKERRERARDLSARAGGELIDSDAQPARGADARGQRRGLPAAVARAGCVAVLDVAGLAEDPAVNAAVSDAPLTATNAHLGTAQSSAVRADRRVGLRPVARPLPAAIDARRERKPVAADPDLRQAIGRTARDPRDPPAHTAGTQSPRRAREHTGRSVSA